MLQYASENILSDFAYFTLFLSPFPFSQKESFYAKKDRPLFVATCPVFRFVSDKKKLLLVRFRRYDFFTVVVIAILAYRVRDLHLVALRALNERRARRLKVCKSGIRSLFGLFTLGNCHYLSTSLRLIFLFFRLRFVRNPFAFLIAKQCVRHGEHSGVLHAFA